MILNLLEGHDDFTGDQDARARNVLWDLIDWQEIGEALVSSVHFASAKQVLLAPSPARPSEELELVFDQLEEVLSQLERLENVCQHSLEYLPREENAYHFLKLLSKSHVPSFSELNLVCLGAEMKAELLELDLSHLDNKKGREEIVQLTRALIRPWRVFVRTDGEVMYEKHPVLAPLFRQLASSEQKLRHEIGQLSRLEKYARAMQMPQYDIVNERFVLPIRADHYSSSMGAIIARSGSGHTLFVEPFEMRQACNERLELLARCEEAKYRICLEFAPVLMTHHLVINDIFSQLIEIDVLRSRAHFCQRYNLRRPQIASEMQIVLQDFFHPLVKNPITNSVELHADKMGVIISGPNTGGKTVALKAICLSLLFMHRSLFVPARWAVLYPFTGLFFIGHDQQNLSAGLSSFAAEATHYLHLLKNLKGHNAIFIDEIFNSTSSDEASALAKALFWEIQKIAPSFIFVSTHHQFLKTSMHHEASYLSAHVGINMENKMPTYRLYWGTPGSSHALTIFRRLSQELGVDPTIVDRAATHLQSGHRLYETLLEDLGFQKVKLDQEMDVYRLKNRELQNQLNANEGVLKLKRQELVNQSIKRLDELEKKASQWALEAKSGQVKPMQIGKRFAELRSEVLKSQNLAPEPTHELPQGQWRKLNAEEVTQGLRVHSLMHAKAVEIISFNARKNEVACKLGPMRINLSLADLVIDTTRRLENAKQVIDVNIERASDIGTSLDARGMRLEEFTQAVESAVTALMLGDIPFLEIIHGHGDGILKTWLRREFLKNKTLRWHAPEGNDGSTILEV